jgi:oligopeptidase B
MRLPRLLFCITLLCTACSQGPGMTDAPTPPLAARKQHTFTHHGITVDDPYHWLKDPGYPEVDDPDIRAYLEAENSYFDAVMASHKALVETLYTEIKNRQQPDEAAVPWRDGAYEYQWRYAADAQYRIWARWPVGHPEQQQTILDEPALAAGHEYFNLGSLDVSPDGRFLAYSIDDDGSERYHVYIKDLTTGSILDDQLTGTSGNTVWANDNTTLFYVLLTENWRPYRVKTHRLGTPVADDHDVYEETSGTFFVGVSKTQSQDYVLIGAGDHVTSETRVVPAATPQTPPQLIAARRANHEYDVDHHGDHFYIRTNDRHKNFRLVRAPTRNPAEANWEPVIDGSDRDYLTGLDCFADFFVLEERVNGLDQVRIRSYDGGVEHYVQFPETSYDAGLGTNAEYATSVLRLGYESMVTPQTVYDYDVASRVLVTRKVRQVPSGYDRAQYTTERLMAPARDGVQVPISIVYRKDFVRDGTRPVYLYGYGAYGVAMAPHFGSARLSLLDRGFVYAIAHIRGGDEMGFAWYEDGKLEKRTNAFNDFIDAARYLIEQHYSQSGRIVAVGGSAGGTLTGAVANAEPQLWGAVVSHVPFVDVLNTILDDGLPLTKLEWPEWGNPIEDKAAFELIRSYSPYDQLARQSYPPMLVTAGLNDPRVTYWEAAKYVARLRSLKTDTNPLLLKTNMGAGHGGKSGRYESLYETAEEYAFLLTVLGMVETP